MLIADPTWTTLCAAVARFGSGKSTLAELLCHLPETVQHDLLAWCKKEGEAYTKVAKQLLSAWYLRVHLGTLKEVCDPNRPLSDALARVLYKAIFGPEDTQFDPVVLTSNID